MRPGAVTGRSAQLLLSALAALLLAGCEAAGEGADSGDAAPDGVELQSVTWGLSWDDSGVSRSPDGSWAVTNDLGIDFVVESAWLVSYSASLVPCEDEELEVAVRSWPERLLGIGLAHADHAAIDDPSLLPAPVVEDLLSSQGHQVTVDFTAQRYCQAHYLVARADADWGPTDSGEDLSLVSVALEGSFDAGAGPQPLSVRSGFNYGDLLPLELASLSASVEGSGHLAVTLQRDLAGLLDGLDPSRDGENLMAWTVVENAVAGTRLLLD